MSLRAQWQSLRPRLFGAIVWALARSIGKTLRVRKVNWEAFAGRIERGEGAIFLGWHGRTFVAANLFTGMGVWTLISLSRDGEVQASIFRRFGFRIIRGSTRRGGLRAALQAAREVKKGGILAFTPDGPRGPNQVVQHGALFVAQQSGCPIIPVGISAWPRKLLPTWDHYLIPCPFARAAIVFGDPITVSRDADDNELARLADLSGSAMNALQEQAEVLVRAHR